MASSMVKRSIWALAFALLVLVLAVVSIPYIASTQIVRDRIALELSAWSGYRVSLREGPDIELWPVFRATLSNVSLSAWSGKKSEPVIDAEIVEVDLSALAALRGDIVFTKARFVRPLVRLRRQGGGYRLKYPTRGGRIGAAIRSARAMVDANPTEPDRSVLPKNPIGTIEFSDGRVVVAAPGGDRELVSSATGRISWASLNRPANLTSTAIWHGESITVDAASPQPLTLAAGGSAPLVFSVKSAPLDLSFDGTANLFSEISFVEGDTSFSTPSLKRLFEWSRAEIAPGTTIGSLSVKSRMTGSAERLKFENAQISLDGNPGMGTLEVSIADRVPNIVGTLAFDTIDLRSLLAAFSTLGPQGSAIDAGIADQVKLDIRLSATKANAGVISLTDVAATAQVKEGLAAFDISDATAFGGNVQMGLRIDHGESANNVEIRVIGENIDSAALSTALQINRLIPVARGNASVILKGVGRSWDSVLETADGSVTASFGKGSMPGLDLAAFMKKASQGNFFALADVADGALPFQSVELKAAFAKGVARIEKAEIVTADGVIELGGIIPSLGRGLALSGTVTSNGKAKDGKPSTAAFFVGGSLETPFVSAILPQWPVE